MRLAKREKRVGRIFNKSAIRKAAVSSLRKRYYISVNETESWPTGRGRRAGRSQREPDWSAINDARAVTIMRRATNTN